ncbi:O-antigen ligase family protein [Rhodococcus globerulus]|uniref:O-antigen ligase family protein n=1 Tax=Rhodococcus globerulus TaxID=33008 RepID=A0ABU4BQU0_RHOGO|nr:O-antigen ligase family protein [Rhodococcus globerulus]MDV6266538.1 O-antigen ligase family protein [Rhodococcus globerulus]
MSINRSLLILCILFSAVPLPIWIPQSFPSPLGSILYAEAFGLAAVALCLGYVVQAWPSLKSVLIILVSMVSVSVVSGYLNGANFSLIFRDLRGIILGVCVCISLLFSLTYDRSRTLSTGVVAIRLIVCWSAIASLLGLVLDVQWFYGRFSSAALYGVSSFTSTDIDRQLLVSGPLCAVAVSVLIIANSLDNFSLRTIDYIVLVSGLIVLLLTFSRNNLVTVGMAVILACLVSRNKVVGLLRSVKLVACIGFISYFVVFFLGMFSEKFGTKFSQVFGAFGSRVLSGLNPDVISEDSSALWREFEISSAMTYLNNHLLFGAGFGSRYRMYSPVEIFKGTDGLTYIHNSFVWVLVKMGVISAIFVFSGLIFLIWRGYSARAVSGNSWSRVFSLAFVSIVPSMYIAPLPFSSRSAVVIGCLVALILYFSKNCDVFEQIDGNLRSFRGPTVRT